MVKKMLNNAPRPHPDLIGIAFYLLPDLQIVEFVPSERRNWQRSISLVGVCPCPRNKTQTRGGSSGKKNIAKWCCTPPPLIWLESNLSAPRFTNRWNFSSAWELFGERYVHGPRSAQISGWLRHGPARGHWCFPYHFYLGSATIYMVYLFVVRICASEHEIGSPIENKYR
jgi:hypothetical protein